MLHVTTFDGSRTLHSTFAETRDGSLGLYARASVSGDFAVPLYTGYRASQQYQDDLVQIAHLSVKRHMRQMSLRRQKLLGCGDPRVRYFVLSRDGAGSVVISERR